jgi:hypothetical protein
MKISKSKLKEVIEKRLTESLFGKKDKKKCEKAREEYGSELYKSSHADGRLTKRAEKLRKVLKQVCEANKDNIKKIITLYEQEQMELFGEPEVDCDGLYQEFIKAMRKTEGAHWTGWDPNVEGDRERRIEKFSKIASEIGEKLKEKCPEKMEQAWRQIDKDYEKYS